MDYWAEMMQDDVYLIAADGWVEAAKPRGIIEDKEIKETPDLTIGRKKYKMDLIPPALIVARYFATEQAAIEDAAGQAGDRRPRAGGVRRGAHRRRGPARGRRQRQGQGHQGGVKDRLKALQGEPESDDERDALTRCLELIEAECEAVRAVRDAQAALDEKVLANYAKLTEAEIKALVVEDKWFASIQAAIEGEVQRLTQQLAGRVKELEERYAQPLPQLELDVGRLSGKVEGHLKKMGLVWA